MDRVALGRTGLTVSRLCFGTLTLGPCQANLPLAEGARLLRQAFRRGVNFVDTAEAYRTYAYLRDALRGLRPGEAVVATKSYAYTRCGMKESLERALRAMGVKEVGVFLLHEQEPGTLEGHRPALEFLLEARQRGLVRAVGVSTHCPEVAEEVAARDDLDVLHVPLNPEGAGLKGGGLGRMLAAVELAAARGKGVYAMKALAGGNLVARAEECLRFVSGLRSVHSVAVGMCSPAELEMNALVLEGREVPASLRRRAQRRPRRLIIESHCQGCGECLRACHQGALVVDGGRARVDPARCVLCGYCGLRCPEAAIKVV
ncbi:MAG: aldo/keto reductase [Acetobacteraceae bacterium]|nr:aldo/keto reductase [Acetobacteraceae bacterium]